MALSAPSAVLTWLSARAEDDIFQPVDAVGNTGLGIIYAGGAIGLNGTTGYVRRWQSGDVFVGFALRSGKNDSTANPLDKYAGGALGDGTAGGLKAAIRQFGQMLYKGTITNVSAAVTAVGAGAVVIYISDDGTFTSSSGGGNAKIGNLVRYDTDLGGFVIQVCGALLKNAVS